MTRSSWMHLFFTLALMAVLAGFWWGDIPWVTVIRYTLVASMGFLMGMLVSACCIIAKVADGDRPE